MTFRDTLSKATPKRSHAVSLPDDALTVTLTTAWATSGAQVDLAGFRLPGDSELQIHKTRGRRSVHARISDLIPGTLRFRVVGVHLGRSTRVQTHIVVVRD
jgi:hypothetical protein